MDDRPELQLPIAKPLDAERLLLSIVVGGHIKEFQLSRSAAAYLVEALAKALAARKP
jgi:hypothetical protein